MIGTYEWDLYIVLMIGTYEWDLLYYWVGLIVLMSGTYCINEWDLLY